jgi:MFS family permease
MLAALRQRNYALLWSAGLVSVLGDWLLYVALPYYIFQATGSALATGAMFIAQTVPRILVGSVAGVFVDRWDRRHTMVAADLARAVLLLTLLVVHSAGRIWLIFVVAFVQAGIAQFFIPAKSALIPRLVSDERTLLAANSLDAMSNNLARLVGPIAGGALLGAAGLGSVILLDSASFLISGLLIARIVIAAPTQATHTGTARPGLTAMIGTVWREWRAGLAVVLRNRAVTAAFVAIGLGFLGQGIVDVLTVPFTNIILHGGPLILGWLLTGYAIGGVTGSFAVTRASAAIPPRILIPFCAALDGLFQLAMFNATAVPVAFLFVALHGASAVSLFISLQTLVQRRVGDRYRGRVFGAYGAVQGVALLCGQVFTSALTNRLGIVHLLDVAGGLYVLAGVLTLFLLRSPAAVEPAIIVPYLAVDHNENDERLPAP